MLVVCFVLFQGSDSMQDRWQPLKISTISKMGLLLRRRSLLLKIVLLLFTAWFTVAFLLYTEQSPDSSPQVSNISHIYIDNYY